MRRLAACLALALWMSAGCDKAGEDLNRWERRAQNRARDVQEGVEGGTKELDKKWNKKLEDLKADFERQKKRWEEKTRKLEENFEEEKKALAAEMEEKTRQLEKGFEEEKAELRKELSSEMESLKKNFEKRKAELEAEMARSRALREFGLCRLRMELLEDGIRRYHEDIGRFPKSGNADLVRALSVTSRKGAPYLKLEGGQLDEGGRVVDPWGAPFEYYNNAGGDMVREEAHNADSYDLYSVGPNGKDEGGLGDDVNNWGSVGRSWKRLLQNE